MSDIVPLDTKFNVKAGALALAIVPTNLDEAYRLAQAISISGLAPAGIKTPEQILIAILTGLEVGLKPMTALQRIAVINGRPTIWGDAAIGLVRASGLCEWIQEKIEGAGDQRVAVCSAKRKGEPEPIVGRFSVDNAKTAKLWGKTGQSGQPTPWVTHPDRMLQMRARGFALRDGFADVLGGMYLREELEGETIDVTPTVPTPPVPPPMPTHGSPELDEDAKMLLAMGQDPGPTLNEFEPLAILQDQP